jgi:hypothetical protein
MGNLDLIQEGNLLLLINWVVETFRRKETRMARKEIRTDGLFDLNKKI